DGSGNTADLNAFLAQGAASDTCGSATITNDFAGLSDLCGATGAATVIFTATDECGNDVTTTATFTIEDTTDPVFTDTPDDVTVECDGSGNIADLIAFLSQGAASDICGSATITNDFTGGPDLCGATTQVLVTFTATDECGNAITETATFTIEDTTPPIFTTVPGDVTVECDGSGNTADLNAFLGDVAASDTCGSITLTNDFAGLSDLCGATGAATVTFTATDECGNQSTETATFTIEDTTDPFFTDVPDDATVECDGSGNTADLAAFLAQGAASDACGDVTLTNDFAGLSDLCGETGSATVTFTATDDCGNTTPVTATFTIEDTIDPVFTTEPVDVTVECDGNGNQDDFLAFLEQGEGTDICGDVTILPGPTGIADLCGETGVAIATFFISDECGNTDTAVATFRIVDATPPVFTDEPLDVTVECDGSGNSADLAAFLAQGAATDLCGDVTLANDFAGLSDLCGETGAATVTFTATDDCGNTTPITVTFTIEDTIDPVFTTEPVDVTVECDGSGNAADLADFLAQGVAADTCGDATIDHDFAGLSDLCGETGAATVTFTATDDCGNTTPITVTFTIEDTTPPNIACTDTTVECDGNGNPADLIAWLDSCTASDTCSEPVSIDNDFSGFSGPTGSVTVTFTAIDACGNEGTDIATFTVEDTIPPTFTGSFDDMTVECDGSGNTNELLAFVGQCEATDVCSDVFITYDMVNTPGCGLTAVKEITCIAMDDAGNMAMQTATFTIEDTTPPIVFCPSSVIVNCADGVPPPNPALVSAVDTCGGVTVAFVSDDVSGMCPVTIIRTYEATDDCGNTATCTQEISDYCGPGACCMPDTTCEILDEDDCLAGAGIWEGACTECVTCVERAHPGWNYYDNLITLTADQPTYWSLLSGHPATGGVAPFTALDPGFPPGRPATDGTNDRVLRGWVLGFAVNYENEEIAWNHLAGSATVVNYRDGLAWEYSTFNFPVVDTFAQGDQTGSPGALNLDGFEYAQSPEQLVFDFTAPGSSSFSGPLQVTSHSHLALHPVPADLTQEGSGPITTKANVTVWNMNEVKFSGTHRCITCWDQTLLSDYALSNHFVLAHLQTSRGKARIDGLASQVCDVDVNPNDGVFPPLNDPPGPNDSNHPDDLVSSDVPLIGVAVNFLEFDGGAGGRAATATNLTGMGLDGSAAIKYDPTPPPPEFANPLPPAELRGTANEKGSLVIWSAVELRWDRMGMLVQDTFLSLTNDYPEDVQVQLYFINGDPPLEATGVHPASPALGPDEALDEFLGAVHDGADAEKLLEQLESLTESLGGATSRP
ncbi:MAG: hypothetical protein GY715_00775, partial [Planctomycetes bacterium]|nr:hypothetical protein [Planctomycetota bacterium]